jgi:hypothetical protein
MSAFAESFTVTTNKDIYTPDEKAIIVGVIPEDAPDGYNVLIKVTGPRGDCVIEHTLPAVDNSFRSRPVRLDECGFGEFTVSAFYADQGTNSTFTISNSSQADAGSRLELRTLKNVILQAQDTVNTRVKELIEGGYVLPEEVADKYSEGVSEASLTLQAIEFGDAAEAKKHMIFAIRDFREVLAALSEENAARFEQTAEQKAANDGSSDIIGTYDILQRKYYKLQNVAEKNQVDKEDEFKDAWRLLSKAKLMIDEGKYEGAEQNLRWVNAILEEIRSDLNDREEKIASTTNGTSPEDEKDVRKLTDTAADLEKDALELLNKTDSNSTAAARLQDALSLIASARINIEAQDLESARDDLRVAYQAIDDAKDLIEHEDDEDGNTSASKESSNDDSEDSDNSNSGRGEGNDGDQEKGSNSGNDDAEDDQ